MAEPAPSRQPHPACCSRRIAGRRRRQGGAEPPLDVVRRPLDGPGDHRRRDLDLVLVGAQGRARACPGGGRLLATGSRTEARASNPTRAASTWRRRHGTGAAAPRTTLAATTRPSSTRRATAAKTTGKSMDLRSRNFSYHVRRSPEQDGNRTSLTSSPAPSAVDVPGPTAKKSAAESSRSVVTTTPSSATMTGARSDGVTATHPQLKQRDASRVASSSDSVQASSALTVRSSIEHVVATQRVERSAQAESNTWNGGCPAADPHPEPALQSNHQARRTRRWPQPLGAPPRWRRSPSPVLSRHHRRRRLRPGSSAGSWRRPRGDHPPSRDPPPPTHPPPPADRPRG